MAFIQQNQIKGNTKGIKNGGFMHLMGDLGWYLTCLLKKFSLEAHQSF